MNARFMTGQTIISLRKTDPRLASGSISPTPRSEEEDKDDDNEF